MQPEAAASTGAMTARSNGKLQPLLKLIADLFKQTQLGDRVISACVVALLGNEQGGGAAPNDAKLEAVATLPSDVGATLDHGRAAQSMDAYFRRLKELVRDRRFSLQTRFALHDVIQLRANRWRMLNRYAAPITAVPGLGLERRTAQ